MDPTRHSRSAALALALTALWACTDPAGPPAGNEDLGTAPEADGMAGVDSSPGTDIATELPKFSFFVTSLESMLELSGSQDGFGGDLRFGEATGIAGADKICRTIAEKAMPGSARKQWRAFLSASTGGPNGGPIHAIERIGNGPWYDRLGRVIAMNLQGLVSGPRPEADPAIKNNLPNERGEPNRPDPSVDNHDTLTGSDRMGRYLGNPAATCNDWMSAVGTAGRPMCGHTWPRNPADPNRGGHWISDHPAPGCAPGVNLRQTGGGDGRLTVGSGGGYGGICCFALSP
jgi:hypothetical protein